MENQLKILQESLMPFYALFSVFMIFCYQEINNKIRSAYTSYREWVKFRLTPTHQEKALLIALGVDKEPDSWLEKDMIFHMFHFYKNVLSQNIEPYKKAASDYFNYTKEHLNFKKHILKLFTLLTILMIVVMILQNSFLLLIFYICTVLSIFEVIKGPKPRLVNNTITNRKNDSCLTDAQKEIKELEDLVSSI